MQSKYNDMKKYSQDERDYAQKQFDFLFDETTETPEEYLERKREVDLSDILLKVIDEQLSPIQREIVTAVKFKGEDPKKFAESNSMELSGVYKTLARAMKTIERFLRYTVYYQRDCIGANLTPLEIKKTVALTALKLTTCCGVGHRIRKLMAKENISEDNVCSCLNIEKERLSLLVGGQEMPTSEELIKLSAFFKTSADYILKGDCN